jgi:hypothetical protein
MFIDEVKKTTENAFEVENKMMELIKTQILNIAKCSFNKDKFAIFNFWDFIKLTSAATGVETPDPYLVNNMMFFVLKNLLKEGFKITSYSDFRDGTITTITW